MYSARWWLKRYTSVYVNFPCKYVQPEERKERERFASKRKQRKKRGNIILLKGRRKREWNNSTRSPMITSHQWLDHPRASILNSHYIFIMLTCPLFTSQAVMERHYWRSMSAMCTQSLFGDRYWHFLGTPILSHGGIQVDRSGSWHWSRYQLRINPKPIESIASKRIGFEERGCVCTFSW